MILWILLDESAEGIDIHDEDTVFISRDAKKSLLKSKCRVVVHEKYISYMNESAADAVLELLKNLPDEMSVCSNTLYFKFLRPITNCLYQVKELLDNTVFDSVVLVGGSSNIFMSCVNAEGEGNKALYRSSWLMNPIIYRFIQTKYALPVFWKRKKNGRLYSFINVVRENWFLLKGVISEIAKTYKFSDYCGTKKDTKAKTLLICESVIQYRFLKNIVKNRELSDYVFACYPEVNQTIEGEEKIVVLRHENIASIIAILLKILKRRKKNRIKISILGVDFEVSNYKLFRALYREQLFSLLWQKSINRLLEMSPKVEKIISNMAIGTDIASTYRVAQEKEVKFINFQYVALDAEIFPNLNMADDYYLYSEKVYNLYKERSKSFKQYFPVFGKFAKSTSNINIAIFLQPDELSEDYMRALNGLLPSLENCKMVKRIVIKPHYRQNNLDSFRKMVDEFKKVTIARPEENTQLLLSNSELMMSICSSVLSEAVFYCTPGIIMDIGRKYGNYIFKNDTCLEDVNFYADSFDRIIGIVKSFPEYYVDYKRRWRRYVLPKLKKERR